MRKIGLLIVIVGMTLVASGCLGGGGGGSGSSGFSDMGGTFYSSSGGSGSFETGETSYGGGQDVAVLHNPEPATMILWGSGLLGMALLKRRKRSKIS